MNGEATTESLRTESFQNGLHFLMILTTMILSNSSWGASARRRDCSTSSPQARRPPTAWLLWAGLPAPRFGGVGFAGLEAPPTKSGCCRSRGRENAAGAPPGLMKSGRNDRIIEDRIISERPALPNDSAINGSVEIFKGTRRSLTGQCPVGGQTLRKLAPLTGFEPMFPG